MDIIDYIMQSPENTNPNVLRDMLVNNSTNNEIEYFNFVVNVDSAIQGYTNYEYNVIPEDNLTIQKIQEDIASGKNIIAKISYLKNNEIIPVTEYLPLVINWPSQCIQFGSNIFSPARPEILPYQRVNTAFARYLHGYTNGGVDSWIYYEYSIYPDMLSSSEG